MNIKIQNRNLLILNILIIFSFSLGFILQENSSGGGLNDFSHIANNYNLIFSNQFSEIDWSKYDSSRYPLHYFLTKIYLPLDLNIIKFNNFLMSMFIPIILFFSLRKKILFHKIYNQNLLLLTLCFIFYLSPYLRTSSYWMLEENFGIFFIILSSIFFYNSFLGKGFNQYLNIFIYLLLSYFAFFCSQNLFVFIVVNFFIHINFFLKKKIIVFLLILTNCLFLFLPYIFFGDVLFQITSNVSNARLGFNLNNIIDYFSILLIYLIPIYLLSFKKKEIIIFFKKNYLKIIVLFLLYLILFWNYESDFLGGGAIKKLLLIVFGETIYYKIFLILSSFIGIVILFHIVKFKDKILLLFVIPYLIFMTLLDYVFQEYLDPLFMIFLILYTNKFIQIKIKELYFLVFYFATFLISANIYYLL